MNLLENKIALITGAARGIGRRTAELFAEEGATVIVTDLKETDSSVELMQKLQGINPECSFYTANAADWAQTEELAKTIIARYGRVDAIVNNAGITRDNLLLRMTPEDWDLVIQINLRSVFNYCKAFIPYMMKKRSGSIINTSSVVGVNGNGGQCNYSAAKAGIIGFTKSFAQEFGSRNIRCNAIAPARRCPPEMAGRHPHAPCWHRTGCGTCEPLPGFGPLGVRYRSGNLHRRRYQFIN